MQRDISLSLFVFETWELYDQNVKQLTFIFHYKYTLQLQNLDAPPNRKLSLRVGKRNVSDLWYRIEESH